MVEAIAQDRQSCQSVFCLMKNPQLYRSAGQLSASGGEHDWLGFELKRKTAGAAKSQRERILQRTLLLETNGCILLIASYSLLRNLCHMALSSKGLRLP